MTDVEWLRHNTMPAENYRMDRIAARYEAMEKALVEIRDKHQHGNMWCIEVAREALEEGKP